MNGNTYDDMQITTHNNITTYINETSNYSLKTTVIT